MKKILLTGAAGFIGFHTMRLFAEHGYRVVGVDNLNAYYSVELKLGRLSELGFDVADVDDEAVLTSSVWNTIEFRKMDITNSLALRKLFDNEGFTHVVHLAAQPGVRYSLENPMAYVQTNLVGFLNVLEAVRFSGVEHLVYASSSSVYGNDAEVPFAESARVDTPVSLYAATKKSNELMAHSYSSLFGIPTTGLRFFTVYGPWGRPDMAPMLFAQAISAGKPIDVFNHGNMQRDFTFVSDIVEALRRMLDVLPAGNVPYALFNIGNGEPVHLMDFIAELERALGKKAVLNFRPMQAGDVYRTWADCAALQNALAYIPKVKLPEGIGEFVAWYKLFHA